MDRVINIFIGGSKEGLKYGKIIKERFENIGTYNCVVWDKDVFQFNQSFLSSLSKASIVYDFGIFVASKDDLAVIRDDVYEVPRDNIIFEYGLFLGIMGNNRTYLVQEDGCKLPTDLLGYTTPRFKSSFNDSDWEDLAKQIASDIEIQFKKSEIQLLPSTSLAIGYYNSFVSKITKWIFDKEGCLLNKSQTHHKEVQIKILIPQSLSEDISAKAQVFYKTNQFQIEEIGDSKRPFPIRFFREEGKDYIVIVDIPTTLNAIRPAINLLVPDSGLGINPDKIKIERKELENFNRTLQYLVSQDDYAKDIVLIDWIV